MASFFQNVASIPSHIVGGFFGRANQTRRTGGTIQAPVAHPIFGGILNTLAPRGVTGTKIAPASFQRKRTLPF